MNIDDHIRKKSLLCLSTGIEMGQDEIYKQNVDIGWWNDNNGELIPLEDINVPEKLCLIHSEISEAMEGHRKNLLDHHLPHRDNFEVELADAMIRIMDLSGRFGLDLAGAVVEKIEYNLTRNDHKKENREKEGGKKY